MRLSPPALIWSSHCAWTAWWFGDRRLRAQRPGLHIGGMSDDRERQTVGRRTGPGDSELVTIKAARLIGEAPVIVYHCARHGNSIARSVASPYLQDGQIEERLMYPVTTETTDHPARLHRALADFYTESAARLAEHLRAGRDVVLLAEGDPCSSVPTCTCTNVWSASSGRRDRARVTSVSASSAMTSRWSRGDETPTRGPGTLSREDLTARFHGADAFAVVMKLGAPSPPCGPHWPGRLTRPGMSAGIASAQRCYRRPTWIRSRCRTFDDRSARWTHNPSAAVRSGSGEVVVVGLGPGRDSWTTPE